MSYRVTMSGWNSGMTKHYLTRPQAIHGMRKLAYDRLAAVALLDTEAAHNVMRAIDKADDILPPQDQRTIVISNTGYTITLANTARAPR